MKRLFLLMMVLTYQNFIAQIKGKVTDEKGQPLAAVSIHIENTYIGTTTNESGEYYLDAKPGTYILVFQYLGYKSQKVKFISEKSLKVRDIQMQEENIALSELVIGKKDNLAGEVIRNAIAHKKENAAITNHYKADFYSRGIFRIKEAPGKILGQKFDAFDEILDSTRSGILYLSETVSKIIYQKPDKLKETIVASKISGNDKGFSYNTAASANFDCYENYLPFQLNVISPIADNAFNYYRYKMEGTFVNENNFQINKIKVIPKRNTEPVMEGYLYIVEDSWALYAIDLSVNGKQIQAPMMNTLVLKQNFSYNSQTKNWIKNTQTLDFVAGMLGINVSGRFTYVYSNYEFEPTIDKRTFTKEVLSFENGANKKDNAYWNQFRPVPLTEEETNDYLKKDLLQIKKKSKTYLDSVDAQKNQFHLSDMISGYTYKNSYRKWTIGYDGLIKGIGFNTVQGWNLNTNLSYTKRDPEQRIFSSVATHFDYGFSEKRFRSYLSYINKFNNLNQSEFRFAAGSQLAQFNYNNPILNIVNTVSTLFFKDNYMKIYERNFIDACFKREVVNGLTINAELVYSERKPVFNTTDYTLIKKDKPYTSNNPLLAENETIPAIEKHNLVNAYLTAQFNFGQQYISRPDGKYNLPSESYPVLYLGYAKGFAANESHYNYDNINARLTYELTLGNKGNLEVNTKAGKFFHAESIAFTDYKHFNGNLTHIGTQQRYLDVYNLLPYYSASTNDAYFEFHAEHDDNGYVMNKIPLLKKLQSTLVLGYHNLSVPQRNPYHEYTIGLDHLGFGKLKVFRIDYIHSHQHGHEQNGVVFGLKILDVLD